MLKGAKFLRIGMVRIPKKAFFRFYLLNNHNFPIGGIAMKASKYFFLLILVCFLLAFPAPGLANKSSVKIEAPSTAEQGSEIIIKIHVTHKGNNFIHYTNWVKIKINDRAIQNWNFSAFSRPEGETFTREVKTKMTEQLTITAEANCNLHGSEGAATAHVLLVPKEQE